MLDITLLRKDHDSVIRRLDTRKNPQTILDVEAYLRLEAERKTLQTRTEELQSQRNALSRQIGQLKAKGQPTDEVMAQVNALKQALDDSAARLDQLQPELQALLLAVPNLPHESVPEGGDEHANVEVRSWGEPRPMAFDIRDHVDLGERIGLDFEAPKRPVGRPPGSTNRPESKPQAPPRVTRR
jgi:seryl-tRNA synthetase